MYFTWRGKVYKASNSKFKDDRDDKEYLTYQNNLQEEANKLKAYGPGYHLGWKIKDKNSPYMDKYYQNNMSAGTSKPARVVGRR